MAAESLFTLVPRRWYAVELIGDEFGDALRSYSPVRVDAVTPLGTGGGELLLDFLHANYPRGVQQKSYRLHVLERQTRYLLARGLDHTPARLLLIFEPTREWLKQHFGLDAPEPGDIQSFMEQRCR